MREKIYELLSDPPAVKVNIAEERDNPVELDHARFASF